MVVFLKALIMTSKHRVKYNWIWKKEKKNSLVTRRCAMMVTATKAFQNVSVDLDIEFGSILPKHTEISLAVIRYVQYPTDHTHLRFKQDRQIFIRFIWKRHVFFKCHLSPQWQTNIYFMLVNIKLFHLNSASHSVQMSINPIYISLWVIEMIFMHLSRHSYYSTIRDLYDLKNRASFTIQHIFHGPP